MRGLLSLVHRMLDFHFWKSFASGLYLSGNVFIVEGQFSVTCVTCALHVILRAVARRSNSAIHWITIFSYV